MIHRNNFGHLEISDVKLIQPQVYTREYFAFRRDRNAAAIVKILLDIAHSPVILYLLSQPSELSVYFLFFCVLQINRDSEKRNSKSANKLSWDEPITVGPSF